MGVIVMCRLAAQTPFPPPRPKSPALPSACTNPSTAQAPRASSKSSGGPTDKRPRAAGNRPCPCPSASSATLTAVDHNSRTLCSVTAACWAYLPGSHHPRRRLAFGASARVSAARAAPMSQYARDFGARRGVASSRCNHVCEKTAKRGHAGRSPVVWRQRGNQLKHTKAPAHPRLVS